MILEQTVSEWVGSDFAFWPQITLIFEVFHHFAADYDEKFLDLLVGDGVEISKADGVATTREHSVTEENVQVRVDIECRPCKLGEAYGSRFWVLDPIGESFCFIVLMNLFDDDPVDFGEQFFVGVKPITHGNGKAHNILAKGS